MKFMRRMKFLFLTILYPKMVSMRFLKRWRISNKQPTILINQIIILLMTNKKRVAKNQLKQMQIPNLFTES